MQETAPLHSAGDLTGTEASGADVDVSGGAIHDRLNPLHIGLPGTVGAAVGVGNLDAEGHALVAEFAFGHVANLLAMRIYETLWKLPSKKLRLIS